MKLLFDQNLSPKLVSRLADLFPSSDHLETLGLGTASDSQVWDFARLHGFTIVTKDADYNNMSVLRGVPPKVLWMLLGNCTTAEVEAVIRSHFSEIETFDNDATAGTLILK